MTAPTKVCPQCSNEYALDQRFCPLDGSTLKTVGGANDLVGSVVADRYYVLRKLGEGGMGQVYLAEHVRMGRKSALKVMHPGMVHDADAISRFNREAANASRISHPNVAAIYDFGETSEGLIYLAMEFVEGESLTAIVERTGALPPLRAADIVRQTGDALGAAHDMGIVHRDLKPDNIMITKSRDGADCVKVVDFGIAKAEGGSQKVTKTGLVVGTPEYMSPEQLAGDKLDGRSDIYSLGLVAFNLLTGQLPFPSESAQESMIMRLTDKPKRLSEMRTDVAWPADLQAVMDRALERDANLRYRSAAEFGRDFYRVVQDMPETIAAAAGTMVMGAVAVPSAGVPPTAVSAAAADRTAVIAAPAAAPVAQAAQPAGAEAAPVAPRSRTPLIAAAAIGLALLSGAAWKLTAGSGGGPAADTMAAAAPADSTAPVQTGTPAVSGASDTKPGPGAPPPGTPAPRPAGTAGPVNPAASAPAPVDVAATLDRLDALSLEEATAAQALKGLEGVEGGIVRGTEQHTHMQLIRARGYLYTGRDADGCAILRQIRGTSNRAGRNAAIDALLDNVCG